MNTRGITILLIALFMEIGAIAQSEFQVQIQGGYYFGIAQNVFLEGNTREAGDTNEFFSAKYSFGKGTNWGVGCEYRPNKVLMAGIMIGYLAGSEHRLISTNDNVGNYRMRDYSSEVWRIIPKVGFCQVLNEYELQCSLGFSLGVNPRIYYNEVSGLSKSTLREYEYTGSNLHGVNYSLGISREIIQNLRIGMFLDGFVESYAPTRGEITSLTSNGKDRLQDLTRSERETKFVDSYKWGERSDDEPFLTRKRYYPFNSLGLVLRVSYSIAEEREVL